MYFGTWQNECRFHFLGGRYPTFASSLKHQECPHPPGALAERARVQWTLAVTEKQTKAQQSS